MGQLNNECTGGAEGHCDVHDAPWALGEEHCEGWEADDEPYTDDDAWSGGFADNH